jgi:mersacidin/lichenicidin family type 2 lantibiotic
MIMFCVATQTVSARDSPPVEGDAPLAPLGGSNTGRTTVTGGIITPWAGLLVGSQPRSPARPPLARRGPSSRGESNEEEAVMATPNETREWNEKVIRAWKDEEYRASLSEAERALLPEHPAGLIEMSDEELATLAGGKCYFITECVVPKQ